MPKDSFLRNFATPMVVQNAIYTAKTKKKMTTELRWCPDLARAAEAFALEEGPKGM